jgi:hypothetical protein
MHDACAHPRIDARFVVTGQVGSNGEPFEIVDVERRVINRCERRNASFQLWPSKLTRACTRASTAPGCGRSEPIASSLRPRMQAHSGEFRGERER